MSKEVTTNFSTIAWGASTLERGAVSVRLAWSPTDPLAVEMGVTLREDPEVVWGIGREMLAEGLDSPDGVGYTDVKVRRTSPYIVMVMLQSPEGVCHIKVPAAILDSFLKRVERELPLGSSEEALILTHAVEAFLAGLESEEQS